MPTPRVHYHWRPADPYATAWEYQTALHGQVVARKLANRAAARAGQPAKPQEHHLIFTEHPPVYTLGKSGSAEHLLLPEAELERRGFTFHRINRGGDITYHGPGQLVAYPIFDLEEFFTDVHRYVRSLEEVVIRTLADYGLVGERDGGFTGVWLAGDTARRRPRRKICAIGVHLSRWTTLHGLAFNVRPNLTHFANIVPCGIAADGQRGVTSLSVELGRPVEVAEVIPRVREHFRAVFGFAWAPAPAKAAAPGILEP